MEELKSILDFEQYLEYISANVLNDCICVIAVKDTPTNPAFTAERLAPINKCFGTETALHDKYRASYLAVILNGRIVKERLAEGRNIGESMTLNGVDVVVTSAGFGGGNSASIKLGGKEYAVNRRGLNIVLYSPETNQLIDSVAIDSYKDFAITRSEAKPAAPKAPAGSKAPAAARKQRVAMLGCYKCGNLGGQLTVLASFQTVKDLGYDPIMLKTVETDGAKTNRLFNKICKLSKGIIAPEHMKKWSSYFDTFILCSDWTLFKKFWIDLDTRLFEWVEDGKRLIAFASSFGTPTGNHDKKSFPKIGAALRRFSSLGIREKAGVEFCKKLGAAQAEYLPDPVFSQKRDFYQRICDMYEHKAVGCDYAAVYLLDMHPEAIRLSIKTAEKLGLKPFFIVPLKDKELVDRIEGYDRYVAGADSVSDWLYYIANSSYTITNSFHALCMSLIFGKDFAAVERVGWSSMRVNDFLARIAAPAKFVSKDDDIAAALDTVIDYGIVNPILDSMYDQTRDFIVRSMAKEPVKLNSRNVSILPAEQCVGCLSCVCACPKKCVTAARDEKTGFTYPEINAAECVSCGLCRSACPVLNNPSLGRKELSAHAGYSYDDDIRAASSSGGYFSELAAHLIREKNAVVFGAGYDTPYKVRHIPVETVEDLAKIRMSKYVQSELGDTFSRIEALLKSGRTVMFCGTPCQSAGLARFVEAKRINRDNLYIIDFACSRVNSPRAYEAYLSDLEQRYGHKVKAVKFRDKKVSWRSFNMLVSFEGTDEEYVGPVKDDPFFKGFLKYYLYPRPSCESCSFRGHAHASDLTIMDAWGVRMEQPKADGVSGIIVQTDKGKELFDAIRDRVYVEDKTTDQLSKGNRNIIITHPAGPYSEYFYSRLDKGVPFSKILSEIETEDFGDYQPSFAGVTANGAVMRCHPSAAIKVGGGAELLLNRDTPASNADSVITLEQGAKLVVNGRFSLARGACVYVGKGATLTLGSGSMDAGSVIACHGSITIGDAVIESGCSIEDGSSFELRGADDKPLNSPAPITIGEHVRLCRGAGVSAGVTVSDGSLIGANSLVTEDVPRRAYVLGVPAKVVKTDISWK